MNRPPDRSRAIAKTANRTVRPAREFPVREAAAPSPARRTGSARTRTGPRNPPGVRPAPPGFPGRPPARRRAEPSAGRRSDPASPRRRRGGPTPSGLTPEAGRAISTDRPTASATSPIRGESVAANPQSRVAPAMAGPPREPANIPRREPGSCRRSTPPSFGCASDSRAFFRACFCLDAIPVRTGLREIRGGKSTDHDLAAIGRSELDAEQLRRPRRRRRRGGALADSRPFGRGRASMSRIQADLILFIGAVIRGYA